MSVLTGRAPRAGLAAAGAVNLVAAGLGALGTFALAAVVSRHLGPSGTGTYFGVLAVFAVVAHTAELGADTGLVRFAAAARATGRQGDLPVLVRAAFGPVLVTAGLLAVATVPAALGHGGVAGLPAGVTALVVPAATASSLTALALGLTRGLGDLLSYPVLLNLALPLSRLVLVGAVAWAGGSLPLVLLAWLLPVPVVLVASLVLARRRLAAEHPAGPADPGTRRAFWRFSGPRGVTAVVEILLEWVDVLLVGVLASPAAAGVYAVVSRCVRAGEVVQQAARVVLGPRLGAAMAQGDHAAAGRLVGQATAAMVALAWPGYLVLVLLGPVVLDVFGPGFDDGAPALALLGATMALATAAGPTQTVLLMGGRSTWQLGDKCAALAVLVALDLLLVPGTGVDGAAAAWSAAILLDTALALGQVRRGLGVRADLRPAARAAALSLATVGTTALVLRVAAPGLLVTVAALLLASALHTGLVLRWRDRLGVPRRG